MRSGHSALVHPAGLVIPVGALTDDGLVDFLDTAGSAVAGGAAIGGVLAWTICTLVNDGRDPDEQVDRKLWTERMAALGSVFGMAAVTVALLGVR
jgi:hypothetical protein